MSRAEHAGKEKKRHIIYHVATSERLIFLRNLQMHHTYLASQRDWSKAGSWHVFELCPLTKTTNSDKPDPQTRETKTETRETNTARH